MDLWLDRDGVPLTDLAEVERLLCDPAYVRVALTAVLSADNPGASVHISTVWLGCNYALPWGPPLIFETMTFAQDGAILDYHRRYTTEQQARLGHAQTVAAAAAELPDAVVTNVLAVQAPTDLEAGPRRAST